MTYFIGVDLGQLQDYSAQAVLRVDDPPPARAPLLRFHPLDGGAPALLRLNGRRPTPPHDVAGSPEAPRLRCVKLFRWPLKTRYSTIVGDMQILLSRFPAGERWELLLDATGVGVAVTEQFDQAGIPYTAVSIHGGEATTRDGNHWRVSKKTLVASLQVAAQNRTLTMDPPRMPYAKELRAEMGNFRHTITAAHDQYAAWRESDHDDLVLALAIAVWGATKPVQEFMFW